MQSLGGVLQDPKQALSGITRQHRNKPDPKYWDDVEEMHRRRNRPPKKSELAIKFGFWGVVAAAFWIIGTTQILGISPTNAIGGLFFLGGAGAAFASRKKLKEKVQKLKKKKAEKQKKRKLTKLEQLLENLKTKQTICKNL